MAILLDGINRDGVGAAGLNQANTWTALQTYSAGINISAGNFQVGGTTVLNDSRELDVSLIPTGAGTVDFGSSTRGIRDVYTHNEILFRDTLGATGYVARVRGTQNQSAGGPSAIEILPVAANTPVVTWLTPNGTPDANTDTGYHIIDEGTPFVAGAASYGLLALQHDGAGGGYYQIGNAVEGGAAGRDVWLLAASVPHFKLRASTPTLGQRGTEVGRNLETQDINETTGPAASQGTVLFNRAIQATSTQGGYSWRQRFRTSGYDTSLPGQFTRNIDLRAESDILTSANGAYDLAYWLAVKDNGGANVVRIAPRVQSTMALLDLSPQNQSMPGLNSLVTAVRLRGATYTLVQNATEISGVNLSGPTLSGAYTTTSAATLKIEGPPAAGVGHTITNPYALWVDSGVTRLDGALQSHGITPQTDDAYQLGSSTLRYQGMDWSTSLRGYGTSGDANPRAQVSLSAISFGAGGASAVDTVLERGAQNRWDLGANDHLQLPAGDVRFNDATRGIILKDTQATPHYWRVTINNTGTLVTTDLGTSLPAT